MLTGEAKKLYQRDYMRDYMRNVRFGRKTVFINALQSTMSSPSDVKTPQIATLRPSLDADGNMIPEI